MPANNIAEVIASLTPEEQDTVRQFVEFLQRRASSAPSRLLAAADEFIDEHPELLRRLAQ